MNDLRIDKLFHDKLSSYEAQPSQDAWGKISDRMVPKKNRNGFWIYSIAASLLVVFTSAIIWINSTDSNETIFAENQSAIVTPSQKPNENTITPAQKIAAEKELQDMIPANRKVQAAIASSNEDINNIVEINNVDHEVISNQHQYSINFTLNRQGPQLDLIHAQITPEIQFLPENNIDLSLPENESGIRKAYDYAVRVKNGEESLINLRKAKNDLFAMAQNIKFNQSKPN